jgi:predicted acylesterase/phospholipase RssA
MTMSSALVLGGGVSKGSWQSGVVPLLYARGIRPDIIVGTSVGSMNGIKLAEGENPADPQQGLTGLEGIWGQLRTQADMYQPADWTHDPNMDPKIAGLLLGTEPEDSLIPDFSSYFWPEVSLVGWALGELSKLASSVPVLLTAASLFTLAPIQRKLHLAVDLDKLHAWEATGHRLYISMVSLESGALRYVTATGQVLERDLKTPVADPAKVAAALASEAAAVSGARAELDSAEQAVRDATDPAQRLQAARDVEDARDSLQQAQQAYNQALAQRAGDPSVALVLDPRDAVIASSSAPPALPPITLGGENYVDGGVRAIVPAEAAITAGADIIYVVPCSPEPASAAAAPASGWRLFDIANRSVDLLLTENARTGQPPHVATGAAAPTMHVIAPDWDVHDGSVVDPGLITINQDYGWMRAADVLDGIEPGTPRWNSATEIAKQRVDIWKLENWVAGQPDPRTPALPATAPKPELQPQVDAGKANLKTLLDQRATAGGPLPDGISYFLTNPERHPWENLPDPRDAAAPPDTDPMPAAVKPGSTTSVQIMMANTGESTWASDTGYALTLLSGPSGSGWAYPSTVPITNGTHAEFNLTAPQSPTTGVFSWRMTHNGIWFGAVAGPYTVQVRDDAQCVQLSQQIATDQAKISQLQQELADLNPDDPGFRTQAAQIHAGITMLQNQIRSLNQQKQAANCP